VTYTHPNANIPSASHPIHHGSGKVLISSLSGLTPTYTYVSTGAEVQYADLQFYTMIVIDSSLTIAIGIGLRKSRTGWSHTDALIKRIIKCMLSTSNWWSTVADGQLHDSNPALTHIGCHHHVYSIHRRPIHDHGFLVHVGQAQSAAVLDADCQYLPREDSSCHAYGYVPSIGVGGTSRAIKTDN